MFSRNTSLDSHRHNNALNAEGLEIVLSLQTYRHTITVSSRIHFRKAISILVGHYRTSTQRQLPACHRRGPGSIPEQSMRDRWRSRSRADYLLIFRFFPCQHNSTIAPYLFVYRQRCITLATDNSLHKTQLRNIRRHHKLFSYLSGLAQGICAALLKNNSVKHSVINKEIQRTLNMIHKQCVLVLLAVYYTIHSVYQCY